MGIVHRGEGSKPSVPSPTRRTFDTYEQSEGPLPPPPARGNDLSQFQNPASRQQDSYAPSSNAPPFGPGANKFRQANARRTSSSSATQGRDARGQFPAGAGSNNPLASPPYDGHPSGAGVPRRPSAAAGGMGGMGGMGGAGGAGGAPAPRGIGGPQPPYATSVNMPPMPNLANMPPMPPNSEEKEEEEEEKEDSGSDSEEESDEEDRDGAEGAGGVAGVGPPPQGQFPPQQGQFRPPQGQFPQGQFPQGQFPQGQFPQGQFPPPQVQDQLPPSMPPQYGMPQPTMELLGEKMNSPHDSDDDSSDYEDDEAGAGMPPYPGMQRMGGVGPEQSGFGRAMTGIGNGMMGAGMGPGMGAGAGAGAGRPGLDGNTGRHKCNFRCFFKHNSLKDRFAALTKPMKAMVSLWVGLCLGGLIVMFIYLGAYLGFEYQAAEGSPSEADIKVGIMAGIIVLSAIAVHDGWAAAWTLNRPGDSAPRNSACVPFVVMLIFTAAGPPSVVFKPSADPNRASLRGAGVCVLIVLVLRLAALALAWHARRGWLEYTLTHSMPEPFLPVEVRWSAWGRNGNGAGTGAGMAGGGMPPPRMPPLGMSMPPGMSMRPDMMSMPPAGLGVPHGMSMPPPGAGYSGAAPYGGEWRHDQQGLLGGPQGGYMR